MDRTRFRRTRYFVRGKFQMRYIGLILAVALLSALISGYTIYFNSWAFLGHSLARVYPQGQLLQIFRSVNIKLVINMFFVALLCTGVGIYASHRIAGPIQRMVNFIDGIAGGDYSKRLYLRKGDELADLAEALNRLVDKLYKEKKSRQ